MLCYVMLVVVKCRHRENGLFSVLFDFLYQQEKFATSTTCVTKSTLEAKAAFMRKNSLLGGVGKRMRFWHIFLALPVKNGPLPTELKFMGRTLQFVDVRL